MRTKTQAGDGIVGIPRFLLVLAGEVERNWQRYGFEIRLRKDLQDRGLSSPLLFGRLA